MRERPFVFVFFLCCLFPLLGGNDFESGKLFQDVYETGR